MVAFDANSSGVCATKLSLFGDATWQPKQDPF